MKKGFNANDFELSHITLGDKTYYFKGATLKDQRDYLKPYVVPRFSEIEDVDERLNLLVEVILHFVNRNVTDDNNKMTREMLEDCTQTLIWAMYGYVINGTSLEEFQKNL